MFKNLLICCLSIFLFYACNRLEKKQTEKTSTDTLKNSNPKQDTLSSVKETDSVVYSDFNNTIIEEEFQDSLFTKFSDSSTNDKFVFTVPKGNINHTTAVLRIFNNVGQLIYENSFKTRYLANGYDLEYIKNDEEMGKYILSKAEQILDVNSFTDISNKNKVVEEGYLNQTPDYFENYSVFLECQKDKRPLFSISLGEEDTTYIGYSKKGKKTVDILYCC